MGTEQDSNRTRQDLPATDYEGLGQEPAKGTLPDPSPDEEIIELVDVVAKGERPPDQEGDVDTFESLDFDFETLEDLGESTPDTPLVPPEDVPKDVEEGPEKVDLAGESGTDSAVAENRSISPERIERVIAETVKEEIERVVKETMAQVAEKVIKEAIEELKQSLEPPSD